MVTPVPTPAPTPIPSPGTSEPVTLVYVIHVVMGLLITLGWTNISNTLIDSIITVVAIVVSFGAQLWARAHVTPVK